MDELEQLKKRIEDSGTEGIKTAYIREDYEPAGDMIIRSLIDSGEFVTRKGTLSWPDQQWRIFKSEMKPY